MLSPDPLANRLLSNFMTVLYYPLLSKQEEYENLQNLFDVITPQAIPRLSSLQATLILIKN